MESERISFSFAPRLPKPRCWQFMLVLAVLALVLAGCRQRAGTVSGPDHTGTYTLASINGNKLPYTPPHEGGAPEVQSATMTLQADGNFTSTMTYGRPDGQKVSRDFSGTYTRDGARFKLQWKGAGTTTANLEGNTFTMDNEGVSFTYRK